MIADPETQPESFAYLPAVFRTEIELAEQAGARQDPVRALLHAFESSLHLAERIVRHSHRLFDPAQTTAFTRRAAPPYFSARDLVDPAPLAGKLTDAESDDPVARFLREEWFSQPTLDLLERFEDGEGNTGFCGELAAALAVDFNRAIRGGDVYSPERFAHIELSPETRSARQQTALTDERLARRNRLFLQDAYPREIAALPAAPPFLEESWERQFLHWLASWLGLELDRDWFDPAGGFPSDGVAAGERYPHIKKIIGGIAGLYRLRGTGGGFRAMAKVMLDLDVEILERTWPRGMEIGVHSAVGLETLLVEEPDLERQFVLLVPFTEHNRARLPPPERGLEVGLLGESEETRTAWFPEVDQTPVPPEAPEPTPPTAVHAWSARFNKLNRFIEQNKPAHTRHFLAFARPQEPEKPSLLPMIVGQNSTIGNFLIL